MQFPGMVTLLGSGETSATGGQVFEAVAKNVQGPLKISILETPAGFEVNAQRVAARVAEFLKVRLQNYQPQIDQIAARKKGTAFSPDSPEIVEPLYDSPVIFFGPGSPSYTVRQFSNSLAWSIIQARHRLGASLVLASAATISVSALALPVYEIYKVGEDPHWKPGLDLFGPYGLSLVIVPHWNNREGGDEVDTSRCFMGQERFSALRALLGEPYTILGIDEHTALSIDFESQTCIVRGTGQVHILRGSQEQECSAGCSFSIFDLGAYHPLPTPDAGLPGEVWEKAVQHSEELLRQRSSAAQPEARSIPPEVQRLVDERQEARRTKDWARADQIRAEIASLGWQVTDTPAGPKIQPME